MYKHFFLFFALFSGVHFQIKYHFCRHIVLKFCPHTDKGFLTCFNCQLSLFNQLRTFFLKHTLQHNWSFFCCSGTCAQISLEVCEIYHRSRSSITWRYLHFVKFRPILKNLGHTRVLFDRIVNHLVVNTH